MIETEWLRAIASFAEDMNLSRAAKRLHLSQPAIHAQLRRLSEALGAPLYRRAGRGLVLTVEGAEAAAFARDHAERTADLVARIRGSTGEDRIVLAAGAGALLYVIGAGLRAFRKSGEHRLELAALDAPAAVDAVRSGLAHVGVGALDTAPEGLANHPLTEVEHVLVMPRDHRLASRRTISVGHLGGERFVLPPEGRPHRLMLEAAFHARQVRVRVGAVAGGWELTVKLVELGFGVAVVNGCCRIPRGLVARPMPELPPVRYAAWTRPDPRPLTGELVRVLAAHGDAWRTPAR